MSPEATAALVGAAVGGGVAFLGQLGILLFIAARERRAAAQIIYAELVTNLGSARTLMETGHWPNTSGKPSTAAWDAYGAKLLRGGGVGQVGSVALAYSSVDALVWLSIGNEEEFVQDDHSESIRDIQVGLYEVGRECGLTEVELEARDVLNDEVRSEWAERQSLTRGSRPSLGRRMWLRLKP